ncbi:ABC transporter substrate-binding protein [Euzebya pacifica]|uniref:ABC transporter substrate-binding protein n=1 Tax=Euzebya pacifica TaxID=1608957 RepID=UPI0013DF0ECA|nr:ABC transporter substrate-binding protein [Euzebya pacifica]
MNPLSQWRRRALPLTLFLALSLIATACGDDGEDGTSTADAADVTEADATDATEADGAEATEADATEADATEDEGADATEADSADATEVSCPGTEPMTLRVAAIAGSRAMTTGLWLGVAEQAGILEEEGLTLDIVDFRASADVNNGLLSGELDMAVNGSGGIVATAQGGDVIGVGGGVDVSVWEPLINTERVTGWDDLAGKTVAVSSTSGVVWAVLGDLLAEQGLTHDDIDPVVIGSTFENYAALESGQVDWIPGAAPVNFIGEDSGFERLGYAPPGGEVPLFTSGYVSTTSGFAEENPEAVVRFMRAWIRTGQWAKDPANFERVVEIATEVSEVEESVARRSMELYLLGDVHSPYFLAEDGEINDESLTNLVDSMVRQEILEEAPSLDDLRTHEYARQAVACL